MIKSTLAYGATEGYRTEDKLEITLSFLNQQMQLRKLLPNVGKHQRNGTCHNADDLILNFHHLESQTNKMGMSKNSTANYLIPKEWTINRGV